MQDTTDYSTGKRVNRFGIAVVIALHCLLLLYLMQQRALKKTAVPPVASVTYIGVPPKKPITKPQKPLAMAGGGAKSLVHKVTDLPPATPIVVPTLEPTLQLPAMMFAETQVDVAAAASPTNVGASSGGSGMAGAGTGDHGTGGGSGFGECKNTPERPIVADLYQLDSEVERLPDFGRLKSIKKNLSGTTGLYATSFFGRVPWCQGSF